MEAISSRDRKSTLWNTICIFCLGWILGVLFLAMPACKNIPLSWWPRTDSWKVLVPLFYFVSFALFFDSERITVIHSFVTSSAFVWTSSPLSDVKWVHDYSFLFSWWWFKLDNDRNWLKIKVKSNELGYFVSVILNTRGKNRSYVSVVDSCSCSFSSERCFHGVAHRRRNSA